jgi:hypothetical protein
MPDREILKIGLDREIETLNIALMAKISRSAISLEEYVNIRLTQGVTLEVIKEDLLTDLYEGGRIFGEFRNAIKATYASSIGRFRDTAQIAEMGIKTKYRWVAVLINTCPDCLQRHGNIATWDEWEAQGLPRTGQTVCKEHCKCVLIPEGATELTPIYRG